jgi:hypothetical protein
MELETLLQQNKIAHDLLCDSLDLDPYEQLLSVANENVEQGQVSKIMMHVFDELCSDILPNFIYNGATQRFVRSVKTLIPVSSRTVRIIPVKLIEICCLVCSLSKQLINNVRIPWLGKYLAGIQPDAACCNVSIVILCMQISCFSPERAPVFGDGEPSRERIPKVGESGRISFNFD